MEERQIKIAFFGPATSGKTWSAKYLLDNYIFARVAFADKLKSICSELFGVTSKNGTDRQILQAVGQKMREIDPDVWIKYLLNTVKYVEQFKGTAYVPPVNIVLDDLRYANEALALKEAGFLLVHVDVPHPVLEWRRASLYPDTPLSSYYHDSEADWPHISSDYTVTGTSPANGAANLDLLIAKLRREHNNDGA